MTGRSPSLRRTAEAVSTVERAALVLSAFRESWDFLTLTDLVNSTGLTKTTVFRLVTSLVAEGLVFQNEANSTYGLGFLNLQLADVFLSSHPVRTAAIPVMRRIHAALNENVALGVRDGDMTYDIEVLESTQMIVPSQSCGTSVLLHQSAPGRALLSDSSLDDLSAYLTRHARKLAVLPGGRDQFRKNLRDMKKSGYASAPSGILAGGHTMAKVIRGRGAVLAITLPLARYSHHLEQRAMALLTEGAREITAETLDTKV
jgi:DNA-binding IclR family transcriptional regulator